MLKLNEIHEIDVLEGLGQLDSEIADIVIADPPYNIGKDFGNNHDNMELKDYVEWSKKWINECIRVMKPTGTMFIYGFSEILAHLSVEIPIHKRWLIWHYTNKTIPTFNFWQRSHEAILCCWKDQPIFNKDEVRVPYTKGFLKGAMGKVRAPTKGRFGEGKTTIYNGHPKGALPRDVIDIPEDVIGIPALAGGAGMVERVDHPTQKPLALCDTLIKSCKPERDGLVLVPFVGSGSECVSAKRLGLNYVGFEINPEYIKIAEERLAETRKVVTLQQF